MKYILPYLTALALMPAIQSANIYSLTCNDLFGNPINMSARSGKKLLVVAFSAAQPDILALQSLDSLYHVDTTAFSIIGVPVDDFGVPLADSTLQSLLIDSAHLSFAMAAVGKAGKSNGSDQQVLLQWLTHVGQNGHFDVDITQDGQMFLVSETGDLFAEFVKGSSCQTIADAIHEDTNNTN